MNATSIAPSVLKDIRESAQKDWPDDAEMQAYQIDSECLAFLELDAIDFGEAESARARIEKNVDEYSSTWCDRLDFTKEEVAAYLSLANFKSDDVPSALLISFKQDAEDEHDWYSIQLERLNRSVEGHRYIERTRAKITPLRDVLVKMESIIGAECYNGNIQNYGSFGTWEGEGRSFRYPTTYVRNGVEEKRKVRTDDLLPEELLTGHYKFGANELSIYRALVRVIDMLEAEYGLQIPRDVGTGQSHAAKAER